MGKLQAHPSCFGVLAEFAGGDDLLGAVERSKAAGYSEMEAYTPLPMHELAEALGCKNHLPLIVFVGGLTGFLTALGMQYYTSVIDYPWNVGGRPLNSWPSFAIIEFELTVLFAAISAVLGMLFLNGLPRPHHPVFDVPEFEQASRNRFFLLLLSRDPRFDLDEVRGFLAGLSPLSLSEVPNP